MLSHISGGPPSCQVQQRGRLLVPSVRLKHSITAAEAPNNDSRFPTSAAYTLPSLPVIAHLFPCDLFKHVPSHVSAHCCSW